jgi:SAM-dependent methyltransferase
MNNLTFNEMPPFKSSDIEQAFRDQRVTLKVLEMNSIAGDAREFRKHLEADDGWMQYYAGLEHDKWMEHFLSYHVLQPREGEVLLDVASHWSPFYRIIQKLTKVHVYLQDLCFEVGIHDNRIGSDCTSIPLPDASVDCISVNNSIEHFEGDRDSRFLREAYRLLKPSGRLCIVPLWVNNVVVNMADPAVDLSDVEFDPGSVLVSSSPWKIRFSRFYTPETYVERLTRVVPELSHEIISIHNLASMDPRLNYWSFIAVLTKP